MSQNYKQLEFKRLQRRMNYHRPVQVMEEQVTSNSPAYKVMTDLSHVAAITVSPGDSIKQANTRMISNKVRMLLVTDEHQQIQGLITATDVMGEKPLNYVTKVGGNHNDVTVGDIMTSYDQLEVLCMKDVEKARVGDIIESLKSVGRQHALVVDGDFNSQVIRGIFSSSQIERQIGESVDTHSRAVSFAELEYALMH
jgi:CBS-domain-containing membrane protein